MTKIKIGSLVLRSKEIKKCLEFYKILGFSLEEEEHEEGPIHYACDYEGFHFAIYEGKEGKAPKRHECGSSQIGLYVEDVDEIYNKLINFGAESIWEPDDSPWGRTAMVLDPDGRPIEFYLDKRKYT